ncbi:ABC transporter permease [Faecalicatena contorta]|uniref:Autoinducer 2 import system permease protein LsrC n=1 Tax=Faecalicatena contorta TaxID=39482 RepID=A0A315ZT64_9FIRM|nr:ABC transporter permease [Faecalicatena contorta]PWJ48745.1 ribose transport system permease protein/AI-2 transport system permease protein [Faecalicatena contorta]SUQ15168.1 ribose transport system permease protein/AI-2 transport system permease protein [Faecalicatena contorta]
MLKKYVPKPGRREYVTFLLLAVEIILFGILAPNFLTVDNLIRVVQNNAEIAMVSIGMTIVMLLGGIDLSVGSVMGVIAIVIGYMLQAKVNIFVIIITAVLIGIAVGFMNGFLVSKFNIPDLIVTIATMNIWKAVIFALLGGKWLTGLNPSWGAVTRAKVLGIPVLLVLIIVVYAVFYYFLMYRRFGRYIYATGCNPQSANLSGINVKKIRLVSYCISGGIAAFAAMLYIARMGSVEMTIGSDLPIACIAAVTIGGTGAKGNGKRGSVIGTLAGVLFIAFLKNGIVILGIPSLLENCFIGTLIVLSVLFDAVTANDRFKQGKEAAL